MLFGESSAVCSALCACGPVTMCVCVCVYMHACECAYVVYGVYTYVCMCEYDSPDPGDAMWGPSRDKSELPARSPGDS